MSDIEDYAYSPYDDLEDILYDADPAPELADDLADHAIHSPVYQDEDAVKNELQEYFSDWEYYSDDYMDDDPTLLRKNPQVGTPPKRFANVKKSAQRGKKRKLVETLDVPPLNLDEDQLLTRCIKGTIWAKPSELKTPSYKDGQEDKVALMKDWKQVFAVKDNGWQQSSGQTEEDESWAKDMSLADMGLQNLPRQSSFEQDAQQAGAEFEEDDGADGTEEEDDGAENLAEGAEEEENGEDNMAFKQMPGPDSVKARHAMLAEEDDEGGKSQILPVSENLEDDEIPRKRRRVKLDLSLPPDSNEAVGVNLEEPQAKSQMNVAAFPNKDAFTANGDWIVQAKALVPNGSDSRENKKRKAVEEPEDTATKSTASSRAKRLASWKTSNIQPVPTGSGTTRSSKAK